MRRSSRRRRNRRGEPGRFRCQPSDQIFETAHGRGAARRTWSLHLHRDRTSWPDHVRRDDLDWQGLGLVIRHQSGQADGTMREPLILSGVDAADERSTHENTAADGGRNRQTDFRRVARERHETLIENAVGFEREQQPAREWTTDEHVGCASGNVRILVEHDLQSLRAVQG